MLSFTHKMVSFKGHMMKNLGEKHFDCKVNGNGFAKNKDLQKYVRTHSGETLYKCKICSRLFAKGFNLDTHSGEIPFYCEVCGKGFTRKNRLKNDMLAPRNTK